MGVLNLAGLSIVGWVAAWRFDSMLFKGCTFFQQVQKKQPGWLGL